MLILIYEFNNYQIDAVSYINDYDGDVNESTGKIGTLTINDNRNELYYHIDDATVTKSGLMSANDKNKVNKQFIQNVEVKSTVTSGTAIATISTSNFNALNEVNTKNNIIYIPPTGDVKQVLQKQANVNNEVEYCILASETLTSVSGTNHTNQDSVSSHAVFNKEIRIKPSAGAVIAKEFHGNLKGTASIATYAEYDKSEINKTAKTTINDKYATKNDATKTAQAIVTSDDEYPILAGNRPASTATTNATLTTVFNKDIKLNPYLGIIHLIIY